MDGLSNFRHPLDPDPVRSTKAVGVLVLGITAAVTGLFLGGLVPATLALLLGRQARREMLAGHGFLTGGRALRIGMRLAWVGVGLAATALVVVAIYELLKLSGTGGTDYAPTVN